MLVVLQGLYGYEQHEANHELKARELGLFDPSAGNEMGTRSDPGKGKGEAVAWTQGHIDEINRLVALLLVVHGRPFKMVRDDVFGDLVRKLSAGRYSPCCTQTLRKYIDKLYENVLVLGKEKIADGLRGSFSISVDGWTDASMDPYCGLVLRFIDKLTLERHKVLLGCMFWEMEHDTEGTSLMIDHCLTEWGILASRISYAVTDNASVMVACIRDHKDSWTRVHCAANWLQLTIEPGLEGTHKDVMVGGVLTRVWKGKGPESINVLVRKTKHVSAFYKNSQGVNRVVAQLAADPEEGMPGKAWTQTNATRWSGFKLKGDRILENAAFMYKYATDKNLEEDKYLNVGEQRMLAQLLAVLAAFYEVTQLFQATDEVSLSHVYPCILKLLDLVTITKDCVLQVKTADGAFVETRASAFVQPVKEFMEYLFTSLTSRWFGTQGVFGSSANRNSGFTLYGVATILDPRFIRNKSISIDNRTYLLASVLPSFFRTHQQEVLAYLKRKDPAAVASAVAKAAPLSSSSLACSSSSSSAAAKGKVRVFAFEDDGSDGEDDEALRGAEGAAEDITLLVGVLER